MNEKDINPDKWYTPNEIEKQKLVPSRYKGTTSASRRSIQNLVEKKVIEAAVSQKSKNRTMLISGKELIKYIASLKKRPS